MSAQDGKTGKRKTINSWKDAHPGREVLIQYPHPDAIVNPKMRNETIFRKGRLGDRHKWGVVVHMESGGQIDVEKLESLFLP